MCLTEHKAEIKNTKNYQYIANIQQDHSKLIEYYVMGAVVMSMWPQVVLTKGCGPWRKKSVKNMVSIISNYI
jgi:hypothetical protein